MDNQKVNREFRQFGDRMYYMLILMILSFIPGISFIASILTLYYSIKILGDIKSANKELKKKELENFRNYFITSYIIALITGIIAIIAVIIAVFALWPLIEIFMAGGTPTEAHILAILPSLLIPLILIIICLGLILAMGILQYLAWGQLTEFFIENSSLFPEAIAYDARKGAENLKTASLCMILGFLVITIFIAFIYEILGYIKLAKLRNLEYTSAQSTTQPVRAPSPASGGDGSFCPYCGAKKEEGAMFCANCGQHF